MKPHTFRYRLIPNIDSLPKLQLDDLMGVEPLHEGEFVAEAPNEFDAPWAVMFNGRYFALFVETYDKDSNVFFLYEAMPDPILLPGIH